MNITTSEENNHTIVSIDGKVDTNTSPDLERTLSGLIEAGQVNLLADFENLSFISSAGLRVLLATAKKTKAQSGSLKVCALNPTVKEVFDISGFSTILSVFPDRTSALGN